MQDDLILRKQKAEMFKALVDLKFGTHRGSKTAASIGLGVQPANLSSMYRGIISIPDKYVRQLAAMPDYVPPTGYTVTDEAGNVFTMPTDRTFTYNTATGEWEAVISIDPATLQQFERLTRAGRKDHNHVPSLADFEQVIRYTIDQEFRSCEKRIVAFENTNVDTDDALS